MPIILLIALLVASGGISYKAQAAVPGDILYGVKTHVDEPVQTFLAGSSLGHIRAAEVQAAARLSEAEQLSSVGLLDTATKSSLETAFDKKSAEVTAGIQGLAESGNAAAALQEATIFRSILEKHQVALSNIYKGRTDSASLAADISSTVSVALGTTESLQSNASELASASGSGGVTAPGAPEAGGPTTAQAATDVTATSSDASTTTPADSIGSAILTLLSKVI
jgi:hypothetical protein